MQKVLDSLRMINMEKNQNRKGIRIQIMFFVASVMTITMLSSLIWTVYRGYSHDYRNFVIYGKEISKLLSSIVAQDMKEKHFAESVEKIKNLMGLRGYEGVIIYGEKNEVLTTLGRLSPPEENFHFVEPIEIKDKSGEVIRKGTLELILDENRLMAEISDGFESGLYAFLVLMVTTLGSLYFFLNRFVIRPLSEMTSIISAMKSDDFTTKLPIVANNEFGILADAFNARSEKVYEYYQQVEDRNQQLIDANEKLFEARAEAERANTSKSQFLANMSHELRTPLNAIIGYSEMLLDEVNRLDSSEIIPELLKILSSGKHLLELINDVLDISKIEAGKVELYLEEFDVRQVVSGVEKLILPMIERNKNVLKIQIDDDVNIMFSDVMKIRQNLLNLLSNAAKFTEKGRITLQVQQEIGEDKKYIVFKIKDTGIGMAENQVKKVFQSFIQADVSTAKRFGGTGLGLSITREFCRLLGGDISVISELGKGSTFTMKLPKTSIAVLKNRIDDDGEKVFVA